MQKPISILIFFATISQAYAEGARTTMTREESLRSLCQAPNTYFAHIDGLTGLDTYIANLEPDFRSPYATEPTFWYGNGEPLTLADSSVIAQDNFVASACSDLLAGKAAPEQISIIEAAKSSNRLWWKVEGRNYDGDILTAFVSSTRVRFTPYDEWLYDFGPRLGNSSVNHTAANRITNIIGTDTANARMYGDIRAYDYVDYCHKGHSLSDLYHDAQDGVFEETITNGIWTGCNEYPEISPIFTASADCEARFFLGSPFDAETIELGGTGVGAVYGDIILLCPNTSKQIMNEACLAGNDYMCGFIDPALRSHCAPPEETRFTCEIEGRDTRLSVCESNGYRTYIYGKSAANPELKIRQQIPPAEFQMEAMEPSYFEVSEFTFKNEGYTYRVFSNQYSYDEAARVEVFRGQPDPANLVATQICGDN